MIRRVCREPGCITILSNTNPGPECWTHTTPIVRPRREVNHTHKRDVMTQRFIDNIPGAYYFQKGERA